jgi:hypothetical protein
MTRCAAGMAVIHLSSAPHAAKKASANRDA